MVNNDLPIQLQIKYHANITLRSVNMYNILSNTVVWASIMD